MTARAQGGKEMGQQFKISKPSYGSKRKSGTKHPLSCQGLAKLHRDLQSLREQVRIAESNQIGVRERKSTHSTTTAVFA